jgi:hypothetical protein
MAGQTDYLPPDLPLNIGLWPQEYQDKQYLDMRACGLIRELFAGKKTRRFIELEIEKVDEQYREHFKARLNYWREYKLNRGKTK